MNSDISSMPLGNRRAICRSDGTFDNHIHDRRHICKEQAAHEKNWKENLKHDAQPITDALHFIAAEGASNLYQQEDVHAICRFLIVFHQ